MAKLQLVKVDGDNPAPRSGHRCCANINNVYLFGGYDKVGNKLHNELWSYNISTKRWTELPNSREAPFECASSSMVLSGDKIFIFGGCGYPFGQTNSNKLLMYSLSNGNWYPLVDNNDINTIITGPSSKYGQSMVLTNDGNLYIFSGTNGRDFIDEYHCFDLETLTWQEVKCKGPRPEPRYRHEVVCTDNQFYVFGGAIIGETFGFQEIHSYEFATSTWKKHQCKFSGNDGFPIARKSHSCVLYNQTVYMCGGMALENIALDDFWKMNLDDLVWHKLNVKLPYRLYFHSAAVTPFGCMYIFGGVNQDQDCERNSDLHEIWLAVPPLQEICWRKLLNLLDKNDMSLKNKSKLLKTIGVHRKLLNRLCSAAFTGNP